MPDFSVSNDLSLSLLTGHLSEKGNRPNLEFLNMKTLKTERTEKSRHAWNHKRKNTKVKKYLWRRARRHVRISKTQWLYSCGGEYFTISIPIPFGSSIAKCLSPQGSSLICIFIAIPFSCTNL